MIYRYNIIHILYTRVIADNDIEVENEKYLMFFDDIVLVTDSEQKLQFSLKLLKEELRKMNVKINTDKMQTMIMSRKNVTHTSPACKQTW